MVRGVDISLVRWLILAAAVVLSITNVEAQNSKPPLERVVTIAFANQECDAALDALAAKGGFTFSYSTTVLENYSTLSLNVVNKTVREIVNQLFEGSIHYKEKGNYIILTKAPAPKNTSAEPLIFSGYVVNAHTQEKIPDVSIYDKKTLIGTTSNAFGYFKLIVDKPAADNFIMVNKKQFRDSTILVRSTNSNFITIPLFLNQPLVIVDTELTVDTLQEDIAIALPEVTEPAQNLTESQANMENISDTLYRKYQVSFVPFVGTNRKLSGNVINQYSFNILGGYSLGTSQAEVGGFFNIDRGDVSHFQVAGFLNAVNGNVSGGQVAGFVNLNSGAFDGLQVAGSINLNACSIKGLQVAGLVNINGDASEGTTIAGLGNFQREQFTGTQVAGLLNVTTQRIDGAQVAGLLNFATKVNGSQIGFLNFADSVRGVPIGFLSFVRSGYHTIEVSADEIFYTNVAIRTGVHQFYNILTAGIKPESASNEDNYWTVGYGIGSAPRLNKWLALNVDLTANQVSKGNFTQAINLLNKLYLGFDIQVAKHFSITAGATLNGYLTDKTYSQYAPLFTNYQPNIIYDSDVGTDRHLQMWWGAKVGVRFL